MDNKTLKISSLVNKVNGKLIEQFGTDVQILYAGGKSSVSIGRKLLDFKMPDDPTESSLLSIVNGIVKDQQMEKDKIAKNAKFYRKTQPSVGSFYTPKREDLIGG